MFRLVVAISLDLLLVLLSLTIEILEPEMEKTSMIYIMICSFGVSDFLFNFKFADVVVFFDNAMFNQVGKTSVK